jgi:hypothetical protein
MGKCKNHKSKDAGYHCQKHNYYLCEECLKCYDRKLYCKFRTSCVIHFMDKNGETTKNGQEF